MADARDADQLSRNKVTHILSVHDSARPMMEVRICVCVSLCVCMRVCVSVCLYSVEVCMTLVKAAIF